MTTNKNKMKDEFSGFCLEFTNMKRLFHTQIEVLKLCSGKPIKDDIAYNLILFSSIEGLVLRITKFTESFFLYLNHVKSSHPGFFGVGEWNSYLKGLRSGGDSYLYNLEKRSFSKIKTRVFPDSPNWNNGKPSVQDYDQLRERLFQIYKPIKAHRDTVVAHKDKKAIDLEVRAVKHYFKETEKVFADLYQMANCGSYGFDIGGVARKPESTAKKMAQMCLTF